MNNLSSGQKLALGGGAALLVSSFLPWYGAFGFNINGWDSELTALIGILTGVAAAVLIGLKAFGQSTVKTGSMATEQLAVILGGLSVIFVLLRFITETSNTKYGLFLAIVASAATAYGAYMAMKEQGLDMPGKGGPPAAGGPPPA